MTDTPKAIEPVADEMEITCGVCSKKMTPQNSTLAPEYFLCDECAVKEEPWKSRIATTTANRSMAIVPHPAEGCPHKTILPTKFFTAAGDHDGFGCSECATEFKPVSPPLWPSPVLPTVNLGRMVKNAISMGAVADKWEEIWPHIAPTFEKLEKIISDYVNTKNPELFYIPTAPALGQRDYVLNSGRLAGVGDRVDLQTGPTERIVPTWEGMARDLCDIAGLKYSDFRKKFQSYLEGMTRPAPPSPQVVGERPVPRCPKCAKSNFDVYGDGELAQCGFVLCGYKAHPSEFFPSPAPLFDLSTLAGKLAKLVIHQQLRTVGVFIEHGLTDLILRELQSQAPPPASVEPSPNDEMLCPDCKRGELSWFAGNGLFNTAIPERTGAFCANCFIRRLRAAGIVGAVELRLELPIDLSTLAGKIREIVSAAHYTYCGGASGCEGQIASAVNSLTTLFLSELRASPDPDSAAGCSSTQTTLEEHTKAVSEFLTELHSIMVDPLADGVTPAPEICKLLLETARQQREQLLELHQWSTWGMIEIAVRNPNVASYMNEWEGRVKKAEADLKELRDRISAPPQVDTWPQKCHLCQQDMESADDRMEWHGLGNCVEVCSNCTGSGEEPKLFQKGQRVRVNNSRFTGEGVAQYDTGSRGRVVGVLLENGNVWEYEVETVKLVEAPPSSRPEVGNE